MPPTLREQIAALSRLEKLELMHHLWDELHDEPDDEPIPEELKQELDRRAAELEADPSQAIPFEQAMAELREGYGG